MIYDQIISFYIIGKTGLFLLVGNFKEQNLQIFDNNYAIFHLKNLLAFFLFFSEFSATKQTKVKQKSQKQKDLAVPKMI
jgi:Leu/Phe-tRNA-protein transferase